MTEYSEKKFWFLDFNYLEQCHHFVVGELSIQGNMHNRKTTH